MADIQSELEYKFKDYPNIKYKMVGNPLFNTFLLKMSEEQMNLMEDALDESVKLLFINAISGSGKTMMAVLAAYTLYLDSKSTQELLYVAAPVQEGALGHTKGGIFEKEQKYMVPLYDALEELNLTPEKSIRNDDAPEDQKDDEVWCGTKTHAYVRGSNIKNKTVIIDEAQNYTKNELKKVLTRIHDNSKVFVIGHDKQNDLPDPRKSGFVPYLKHFEEEPYARTHKLSKSYRGRVSTKADEFEW